MSNSVSPSENTVLPVEETRTTMVDSLLDMLLEYINQADDVAAANHVAKLRKKKPNASTDQIIDDLIRQKILKTGVVGAVTSGTALVPGVGTFASLTFGVAADIGMTFKLQAELVLEIAAAYGVTLTQAEKQRVILLVTGISAGANQLLTTAGAKISQEATERLVQQSVAKAIPVIGIGVSGGVNALSTYLIGRRANAYFALGEEEMEDWAESIRALSGVDERKIAGWLSSATWSSWEMIRSGAAWTGATVKGAGSAAGNAVMDAGRGVLSWGRWAGGQIADAGEFAADKMLWWRRDETKNEEETKLVQSETADIVPEKVIAIINAEDESAETAASQIAAAQALVDGETAAAKPSIFSYLNPRDWFNADETDVEPEPLELVELDDDDDKQLRVFSPLAWFKKQEGLED